jgi:hypothetical protein
MIGKDLRTAHQQLLCMGDLLPHRHTPSTPPQPPSSFLYVCRGPATNDTQGVPGLNPCLGEISVNAEFVNYQQYLVCLATLVRS